MGLTHVELQLTNLFSRKSMRVRALVDTGAMFLCVTQEIAVQLGFDTEEAETGGRLFPSPAEKLKRSCQN